MGEGRINLRWIRPAASEEEIRPPPCNQDIV